MARVIIQGQRSVQVLFMKQKEISYKAHCHDIWQGIRGVWILAPAPPGNFQPRVVTKIQKNYQKVSQSGKSVSLTWFRKTFWPKVKILIVSQKISTGLGQKNSGQSCVSPLWIVRQKNAWVQAYLNLTHFKIFFSRQMSYFTMEKLGVILFLSAMAFQSVFTLPMMRTAPTECPLENGNLIDVHLFISDEQACRQLCQDDEVELFL